MNGEDPFLFVEEDSRPSWYLRLGWDVREFVTKSFGLDLSVWIGRIVVSLLLVLIWDAYWAAPSKPRRKHQCQAEEKNLQETKEQPISHGEPSDSNAEKRDESKSKSCAAPENLPSTSALSATTEEQTRSSVQFTQEATTAVATKETTTNASSDAPVTTGADTKAPPEAMERSISSTVSNSNSNPDRRSRSSDESAVGLKGFHYWYEVETSLYRIYTLAHKDPSVPTIPPYFANSKRGNVAVEMRVTNRTHRTINVYWVDYKGKHIPKGNIPRGSGVWTQTTWIDHPWAFEDAVTGALYFYFVPQKVIPTISLAPTVGSNGNIGLFEFNIIEPASGDDHHVGISDRVLPFPGSAHLDQPLKAIRWTLQHMSRFSASSLTADCFAAETATLQKYLLNIMNHPETWKYRHLRISSKHFSGIWNTPLRGLLLAVGFVEDCGFCCLGWSETPISSHKVQEIALLSYLLSEWTRKNKTGQEQSQPNGASDGFGRSGFGRAGAMG